MINKKSINEVNNAIFSRTFMKPLTNSYCFSKIPSTVKYLLGDENAKPLPKDVVGKKTSYNKVVVLLVDGFGWRFFEKYKEHSTFISDAISKEESIVSKLTTQFPTSTTSNITTMHTGLPVGQSGIIEWFQYDRTLGDVYSPFLYALARDKESESLAKRGVFPETIFPSRSIYQDLKRIGVESYLFHYGYINDSSYSSLICKNANQLNYEDLGGGLAKLGSMLKMDGKGYYYFYYPDFDKYCHEYGPNSKEAETEIIESLKQLDLFYETIKCEISDTLFILTADHGLSTVEPDRTVYINKEFPEVLEHLKRNSNGEYIIPCGGFRNMFLHIKEGKVDVVKSILSEQLVNKAEVFTIQELLNEGVFGSEQPSAEFMERVGDLVILPYKNEAVWWYEEGQFSVNILGQHGGLTKEEIEIPYIAFPIN